MRAAVSILWFLTAFLTGAIIYAAIQPHMPERQPGLELKGLFNQCRQAGACAEPGSKSPGPPLPADIDRA